MERINKAGGWLPYVDRHATILAGVVKKCAPALPEEIVAEIATYVAPAGGY